MENNCSKMIPVAGEVASGANPRDVAVYGVLIPLFCLVGIVGNVLNVLVLSSSLRNDTCTSQPSPPNTTATNMYTFLIWLAVADLLLMLLWIPMVVKDGWDLQPTTLYSHRYYTNMAFPLINCLMSTSSFLVALITLERFCSICYPFHRYEMSRVSLRIAILISFILPLIIYLPTILGKCVSTHHIDDDGVEHYCEHRSSYKSTPFYKFGYTAIRILLTIIAPLIVIASLNIFSMRSFHQYMRENDTVLFGKNNGNCPARMEVERKRFQTEFHLALLLTSIVTLYTVCMLPHAVFHVLHYALRAHQLDQSREFENFRAATNVLGVLNSALNFYMYCLTAPKYRVQFRYMLLLIWNHVTCWWCGMKRGIYRITRRHDEVNDDNGDDDDEHHNRQEGEVETAKFTIRNGDDDELDEFDGGAASRRTSYGSTATTVEHDSGIRLNSLTVP